MRKIKGFRIGRKLVTLCSRFWKPGRKIHEYQRLKRADKKNKVSRIYSWGKILRQKLCYSIRCSDKQSAIKYDEFDVKPAHVPKGHLAVYVGERNDGPRRVLVPVIYFNHPLFGELLKEVEEEYGFHHDGGINIPCRVSKFESVKTRIAASADCHRETSKLRSSRLLLRKMGE